jgi:hypothetical protein
MFSFITDGPGGAAAFIGEALGLPSISVAAIEEQMVEDLESGDVEIEAAGATWWHVSGYDGGEVQYGQGYGDTHTIAGYWMVERMTVAEARSRVPAILARQAQRWTSGEPFADPFEKSIA